MKFLDLFNQKKSHAEKPTEDHDFKVGKTDVKVIEVGTTGTENYAGYLSEEYLQELRGQDAADIYDRMRRSDAKIKMILSAMKNPIKGATWEVVEKGDSTREGAIQKAFIEHILFNDLGKDWKSFLHEALSCIDFGYSIFEITYKAELNHPVWGSYNGIKSLAFRSQRTIERWNVHKSGQLDSISQYAFGDTGKLTNIDAKYLLHFALEKEGDNYEGISILRPCYGAWLRKNTFLKLIAAGTEKYAIPIPTLKIPAGKQNSKEYKLALAALQKYVSHQCNYITVPEGWDLELKTNPFDASKIREVINEENVEIVNAALANFLELGQSGSGSYALSFDLSDFFLGGLEFVAETIAEKINRVLIPNLINLNFVDQEPLVELKVSGISDKAGEEFAKIISGLVKAGVLTADDRLEDSIRKRMGLPERDESSAREMQANSSAFALAEDKPVKKKSKDPVKRKIEIGGERIKNIMQKGLKDIASQINDQAVKHWQKSSDTNKVRPPKKYSIKGLKAYKDELTEELAGLYNEAVDQAKNENRRFRNIALSENAKRMKLAEKDKLNQKALVRLGGIVDNLVAGNIADIEKDINLQYTQSAESTDSPNQLSQDLQDKTNKTIDGQMTVAGGLITASTMVNIARKDFFNEIMKENEVESFTWVNPDPVSEICKGLNGITLPAGHLDVDRYWPPLHHNCKTYVVANTTTTRNNPTPQDGFAPTKTQAKSITLADDCC